MKRTLISNAKDNLNQEILLNGWVHRIRKLKKITFIILRDRTGIIQCVIDSKDDVLKDLKVESVVAVKGKVVESNNSISNVEIQISSLEVISPVNEELPIIVNRDDLQDNIDTILNNRVLSLKNIKTNKIFKVQAKIAQKFTEFLVKNGFTQVFTPKIVAEGAEGGTALFEVKYFENKAYLAQSPQFYKQMLICSGYERVFEIGHVYRAEEHNTVRHLNEYVSLDLEMGFIKDETDVMELETELLKYILNGLKEECMEELQLLNADIPNLENGIPRIKLEDAINILKREYGKCDIERDLDPEGEKLISKYVKEKYNSDFVFLTCYPRSKRPMYTMPYLNDSTRSFDLIFRGLEVTTGGQRIHDYNMLVESMISKGLNPSNYEDYLKVFKYGMPPHGGLAIGLERLTAQLLSYKNIRETSLFPRDRTRTTP